MDQLIETFSRNLENPTFFSFLIVYLSGVLTSLTPCVLPMLPVTVATITVTAKRQDGTIKKSRAFLMSCIYASGVIMMFVLLGVLAASTGKAVFGQIASSWITYLIITIIMLLLTLWMWIGDRIDPSAWIQNWSGRKESKITRAIRWAMHASATSYFSTFIIGALAGLLAGPCSAPVISLILLYVAKIGSYGQGILLMSTFGLGLTTIMIIAGTSTTFLSKIKGKGRLAMFVKKCFIALMFCVFAYFLHQTLYFAGLLSSDKNSDAIFNISELPQDETIIEVGGQFPEFTISREDVTQKFSELQNGRKTIIVFWGIWCKGCVEEIPEVKRFLAQNKTNVGVISINVNDQPGNVHQFAIKEEVNYPIILDPESDLVFKLGVMTFPYNLVIDREGKIVFAGSHFPSDTQ